MDVNEQIFKAAFASLQGQPANTDSFCTIARACVRCADVGRRGSATLRHGH
jgi:hypothetical protein